MPHERIDPLQEAETQRVVVLQLLCSNRHERWTRVELERELYDIDPQAIGVALERLQEQGAANIEGEQVSASACAWHLDALGFICI